MLWLKAFHVIFMVTWFAGLFYLPRIFVYHAMTHDVATIETFKVMERKLMVMTHIGGALTWLFGLLLLWQSPGWIHTNWFALKLLLVLGLTAYHFYCMHLVRVFATGNNRRGHSWYRWFNEVPTLGLIAIVILVVLKPF
ncbi:MAG: CopD family protein [Xanthomonadales bacterium]|nr:CopD family protein [Xanthomonadales bacterium]